MKKLLISVFLCTVVASPAHALLIDPSLGLTDFVFDFGGVGSSATFSGDDTLEITLAGPVEFDVHVEDCCVVGDEWDLIVNGTGAAWDIITSGDGSENGMAAIGAAGTYFEALATVTLGAGSHTLDLLQTAGISGGAWINVSAVRDVPEPLTTALVGLGLIGLGGMRRRAS